MKIANNAQYIPVPSDRADCFTRSTRYEILTCIIYVILGTAAVIYKANYEANGLFDGDFILGSFSSLREMTVIGTVLSTLAMALNILICVRELRMGSQYISGGWYYLRLAVCVTETIILMVVLIGLLPVFPDKPNFTRFDCMQMHVTLPVTCVMLFIFRVKPIGILKPYKLSNGLMILILYAVVMLTLVATDILPDERAPYSFLRIHEISASYILLAIAVVYGIGFCWTWLFYRLNRKFSKV